MNVRGIQEYNSNQSSYNSQDFKRNKNNRNYRNNHGNISNNNSKFENMPTPSHVYNFNLPDTRYPPPIIPSSYNPNIQNIGNTHVPTNMRQQPLN